MKTFAREQNPHPASSQELAKILANPGFAKHFSDHMAAIDWSADGGWGDRRVEPYAPICLNPASLVFHYGQEIFEGLKIFRYPDGSLWSFRPGENARRFQRSARRLTLPELSVEDFLQSLREWVAVDGRWVPTEPDCVYARPFMIATEAGLGIRPSNQVMYRLICAPASPYIKGGPAKIWVSKNYTRAAPGGTGAAKCGGNYAASLLPQTEALAHGCSQTLFLDARSGKYLEELGGMNIFLVTSEAGLITPRLSGTILEGITRASVIEMARADGMQVTERNIEFDWLVEAWNRGEVTEIFACGTAASITGIGELIWESGRLGEANKTQYGPVTTRLREELVGVQYGRLEDRFGWMERLDVE